MRQMVLPDEALCRSCMMLDFRAELIRCHCGAELDDQVTALVLLQSSRYQLALVTLGEVAGSRTDDCSGRDCT